MWEQWKSCPVRFTSELGGRHGYYDRKNDIIWIDLGASFKVRIAGERFHIPANSLLTYLALLLERDNPDKNGDWVAEQAMLLWTTFSQEERWQLGHMLFEQEG